MRSGEGVIIFWGCICVWKAVCEKHKENSHCFDFQRLAMLHMHINCSAHYSANVQYVED